MKIKSPSVKGQRAGNVRLPGLMSKSVLLWDKLRIHIYRIKHGKLRISLLNSDI
jgi:hypothetical protein